MKRKEMTVLLDAGAVDTLSGEIQNWLEEAGAEHTDIIRFRLTAEELLEDIQAHFGHPEEVKIILQKFLGSFYLIVRYGGDRFDPVRQSDSEVSSMIQLLLTQTGLEPSWRWRAHHNELVLGIPGRHLRPEQLMLGCVALAVAAGLAGPVIPMQVKTGIIDYGLSFLSVGFLNLLNTFISLMVFLSVVNGICGIGNASVLGKIGKVVISRFIGLSFLFAAVFTAACFFCFPVPLGGAGGTSQLHSILDVIFGILPSNPVRPFLEGNTLQIVFIAVMIGAILVLTGSQTEHLRILITELHAVTVRCVSAVCIFLPIYIFSSLVIQMWTNGPEIVLRFGKPLLLCILFNLAAMACSLAYTCMKLELRPSMMIRKLMPDYLIGLTTSSGAAALPTSMEVNEKSLGIDPAFSKVATPIGTILFSGTNTLNFVLTGAFLANSLGMQVNAAWWIILWIISALLSISTPPVAGGVISCLTVLLSQIGIPQTSLAVAITLVMFIDFPCTASRIFLLHLETLLQAHQLKRLNHDILRNPQNRVQEEQ